MNEAKFKKGDLVRVVDDRFKEAFPSIYKVKNVIRDSNGVYLYTILDAKNKRILRTKYGYVAEESWLELVADNK